MAVALDEEREIAATLTSSDACATYYREGLMTSHFADPRCRVVFGWAMEYFGTHGRLENAPSKEVMLTEFPDYEDLIAETKGAAPSYLSTRLKDKYIKREAEDTMRVILPGMGGDAMGTVTMLRDAFSTIVDNCTPADECLEYGKDMEAYRKMMAERRDRDGVPYPFKEMQDWTGGVRDGELAVLVAPPGTGKAQPLDSHILTDGGWVRMGDIKVGDCVKNRKGGDSVVSGVFPQGKLEEYRVTFADGRSMLCNDEHLFTVRYKGKNGGRRVYKERSVTVREMLDSGIVDSSGRSRWFVPLSAPVEFSERSHVIDPYVLGVLIGDGCLSGTSIEFSSNEEDIVEKVSDILGDEYVVSKRNSRNYSYGIRAVARSGHRSALISEMERLGLRVGSVGKFIPEEYLFDSVANRKALLAGLFDTDGCVTKSGSLTYSTRSERLSDDVVSLARGLGYSATKRLCKRGCRGVDITVTIITDDRIFSSSKHSLRYERFRKGGQGSRISAGRLPVRAIERTGRFVDMQCIMVDDDDHLYISDEYCLTHNTVFACKMALEAWRAGYRVYFASLELPIGNVTERIEYMVANENGLRVPIAEYRRGTRPPQYEQVIREAQDTMAGFSGKLFVEQPRVEDRTPTALVRACKARGCNFLIVDQLQFVMRPKRDSLPESYGAALQEFKQQIMTPVDNVRLPMLLLHQMNRQGTRAQHEGTGKVGSMADIAGSAWVEQISDIVWGIGRNEEEKNNNTMNLATLKVRNVESVGWRLSWDTTLTYQFDILRDPLTGNSIRLEGW